VTDCPTGERGAVAARLAGSGRRAERQNGRVRSGSANVAHIGCATFGRGGGRWQKDGGQKESAEGNPKPRYQMSEKPQGRKMAGREMTWLKSQVQMTNARIGPNDRKMRGREMSWLESKVQMTNDQISSNAECRDALDGGTSGSGRAFGLVSSFVIWISAFPRTSAPNSVVFVRGFVIRILGLGCAAPRRP